MKITRNYDDNGQSRFADIDISLNPREPPGRVSGLRVSAPFDAGQCFLSFFPRCVEEPHTAPRRQLVVILSGEVKFETNDGDKRHFGPGDMVLADEHDRKRTPHSLPDRCEGSVRARGRHSGVKPPERHWRS
jgi:hypothetical protein